MMNKVIFEISQKLLVNYSLVTFYKKNVLMAPKAIYTEVNYELVTYSSTVPSLTCYWKKLHASFFQAFVLENVLFFICM